MKKYRKGSLIGFPFYRDEDLSDLEVSKMARKIKKQIQIQDVIPIILAIIVCVIVAAKFLG